MDERLWFVMLNKAVYGLYSRTTAARIANELSASLPTAEIVMLRCGAEYQEVPPGFHEKFEDE